MPRATPTKQTTPVEDQAARARGITEALLVVYGERENTGGVDDIAARALAALTDLRNSSPRQSASSSEVQVFARRCEVALSALDEMERLVRPAVEHARELSTALAADIATAEEAARSSAVEARRAAEFEAAVQDEVEAAERKRLEQVESAARKRLATAGGR